MKTKEKLLIVTVALVAGAMFGLLFRNWAAWAGSTFVLFALIYAGYWRYENWKARKGGKRDPEIEGMAVESDERSTAEAYNPNIAGQSGDDLISRDKILELYTREFNIPWQKAENLYDAGYTRLGDFSEAIPADLIMVDGINPTLARKIISRVNSEDMNGT